MIMNLKDLKIEFFKSRGPGGQHKNKRNMAVRVTHMPSGLAAVAQEYRSQQLNKKAALGRLREKLREKYARKIPRIPTRKPRVVKERILEWKKKRTAKKRLRREKIDRDYEW